MSLALTPLQHRGPPAGDPEGWRARLRAARERAGGIDDAVPPHPDLAASRLEVQLEVAGLAAAVGDRAALVDALSAAASWGTVAALGERLAVGTIVLQRPGAQPIRVPAEGNILSPPQWQRALAAAVLVRDSESVAILASDGLVDLVVARTRDRHATVGAEPFWRPWCRLFAAAVRAERASPNLVAECRQQLRDGASGVIDPDNLAAEKTPVVNLLAALEGAGATEWEATIRDALGRFDAYYAHPERAMLTAGMLPLSVAAVCAMAHDRHTAGRRPLPDSPYLPVALIQGDLAGAPSSVVYEFPRRSARDAREINWWLDLEGVPRSGREHRLLPDHDDLIARYQLNNWPNAPRAVADFVLIGGSGQPRLLDAGELLLVADWHATKVAAARRGPVEVLRRDRFHLQEAVAALDELKALIPPGATGVPEDAAPTSRGGAVWRAEPGRFDRERLNVVRGAYQQIIDGIDFRLRAEAGGPNREPPDPEDARVRSLQMIEVIREQVAPILDRLARDRNGELVRQLKPRDEDYAKVFLGQAVAVARQSYEALWSAPLQLDYPGAELSALRSFVSPAGMLAAENELSRHFPGGYRGIARWLNPHRVWVCWRYTRPGEAGGGLSYDGLVWCDDHWAWFPKPYRALRAVVG